MPRKKIVSGKKQGGPKIDIDWNKVDEMLEAGAIGTEIAPILGISTDTLYDRTLQEKGVVFSVYAQTKRSVGDYNIRLHQYRQALGTAPKKGNIQLLMRLGEQRLGQANESNNPAQTRALVSLFARCEKLEAELLRRGINVENLENEQSLLDQGQVRQQNSISNELGSEDIRV